MVLTSTYLKAPYFCYVNLTNNCNLRCLHCLGDYSVKIPFELNLDEWKKVFDELARNKVFYINISGGEPTTHPNFAELLDYLSEIGLHFILTTNGVFSKRIRDIILKNKEYLIGVKISLDGPDARTHCDLRRLPNNRIDYRVFEITVNNILAFKKNKLPLTIATVLHKGNIEKFDQFIDLIRRINPVSWFISPIIPSGRGNFSNNIKADYYYYNKEFWIDLVKKCNRHKINVKLIDVPFDAQSIKSIDYYACGAGLSFCEINSDGIMSPCTLCRTCIPSYLMKFESLKNKTLEEIWNGAIFNKCRGFMQKGCTGCKAFSKCTKCIAQSFRYFKNGTSPTPYCIRNADALGLAHIQAYKQKLHAQEIEV